MQPKILEEPWHDFFSELDSAITEEVCLHCLGGFVIQQCYGLPRTTSDVDVISFTPNDQRSLLLQRGGEGSPLHRKYGVYLQSVSVAQLCLNYEDRLNAMFPGAYRYIRLFALDAYDLALSKLDRNSEIDRADVKYLIKKVPLDHQILQRRYESQLRPEFIGNVARADLTMRLWLEAYYEQ
jgi:hypothetical protein